MYGGIYFVVLHDLGPIPGETHGTIPGWRRGMRLHSDPKPTEPNPKQTQPEEA